MIEQLQKLSGEEAAKRLLGAEIVRITEGRELRGRIVETEAYIQSDPASHSYNGRTNRNKSMFLGGGHVYVYISYGIHRCLNVVCGKQGRGSAVLLRALEPLGGIETMQRLRSQINKVKLTNGPGKLTQALKIDESFDGHWLQDEPLILKLQEPIQNNKIVQTKRVGITKNTEEQLRFHLKGNQYVSKK